MEGIYKIIQGNPEFFAWIFGLINVLWLAFTYFNRQSHERALANLAHTLKLDEDRRLKVFELKASQYESYVSNLDAFGKKHQVDLPSRMQPIMEKYLADYLNASSAEDKKAETEVISRFSSQVLALMQDASEDYYKIQAESNKIKLTATEEMGAEFEKLESLIKNSMDDSLEFMGSFTQMVMSKNFAPAERFQERAKLQGEKIKASSKQLINLMRAELHEI